MNLRETTVRTKLIALTVFFLVDIALLGLLSYWQTQSMIELSKKLVSVNIPSISKMGMIDMMHDGTRANVLNGLLYASGAAVSTPEEILAEQQEFSKQMTESLEDLKRLDLDPQMKDLILKAEPEIKDYIRQAEILNKLSLAKNLNGALGALPAFQKAFEILEEDLGALGDEITASSKKMEAEQGASTKKAMNLLLGFAGACLIFGALVSWLLIRGTMKTVSDASAKLMEQVNVVGRFAASVDNSALELSKTVETQAQNVQRSAATIHQISEMAKLSSDNALAVRASATSAVEVASSGKERVSEMVKIFQEVTHSAEKISASVNNSNQQMTSIVEVIQEISKKTQVINEIVFQTKLLSFNASVEAARAGENGKGFSVVAEEVGNLARSSGEAADQISSMLTTSIKKVEETVKNARTNLEEVMRASQEKIQQGESTARECDLILDQVVTVSQGVQAKIDQISRAIQEQSGGVKDMTKTLQDLESSISETHDQSKQSASHASGMSIAANDMTKISTSMRAILGVQTAEDEQTNNDHVNAA